METSKQEKETAIEANQMLTLMIIEDIASRSKAEQKALLHAAQYKQNMDKRHVLCNDEKVLTKYYDSIYYYENKPTLQEKLWYTLRSIRSRL